jgi:hypothetical protein
MDEKRSCIGAAQGGAKQNGDVLSRVLADRKRRMTDLSPKVNQVDTRRENAGQGMAHWSRPRIAEGNREVARQRSRMTISRRFAEMGIQFRHHRSAIGE